MTSYQKLKARNSKLEEDNRILMFLAKRFQSTLPSIAMINHYHRKFKELGFYIDWDTYDHQASLDKAFKERQRQYQLNS